MIAGPQGWAFRDRSAGILWARNNCLGLAAQLPAAQISDPRGLDTPSMGTWPGTLPLPLLLPQGLAPFCRGTVVSPSGWGPQVASVLRGWAVRLGACLGEYRAGPFFGTQN